MPLTVTRGVIIVTKNSYHEENVDIVILILIITEISVFINKTNTFKFEFDKNVTPDFYTESNPLFLKSCGSDVCGQTYGTTLGFSI